MSKIINKFLDRYLGDEIVVKSQKLKNSTEYFLFSNNKVLILSFRFKPESKPEASYVMFRGNELCKFVSNWFGLTEDDAMRYIRDWFADKHNIKKYSDLNKFIKEYDTTRA